MSKAVKRPAPLSIRLNDSERAALAARARGVGLSTYAKSVLFGDRQPERASRMSADRALLAQVLGQLGASGLSARVAALAEAAESGSLLLDAETTARLRGASEDIREMRRLLMTALGWQLPARETSPASSPTAPASKSSPSPSAAQPLIGVRTLYVTASNLNVRSSPSPTASVLLSVPRGTKVVTLSTRDGWYEVALNNGSSGWLSGDYLADRPPSETATPRPSAPAAPAFDRNKVIQAIIEESIWSTGGSCPCPYNVDRGGRRCGGRSAYSRPGGASPICFPEQVTDRMVQQYLARN